MDKPTASPASGAKQQIEKQARQLAYDTRYKVKQAMSAKSGARLDPAAVRKAYMAQLGKSSAAPAVKARAKQMLLGEDLVNAKELANDSLVSALYKVFVEGVTAEEIVEESEESGEKKYKIRVTDKKTGNTYVRMATRSKIAELRRNPNIASVEMTSYGEVSKSEKETGSQTAAAKAGKDYDGDGKVESGAKEYRGAVHNAIQRKKGLKPDGKDTSSVKEEIIYEKEDKKNKKITGEKVDNYKSKAVKVSPDVSEQMKPGEEMPEKQKPVQKPVQDRSAVQQVLLAKQKVDASQKDLANKQRMAAQKKVDLQSLSASYEPEGDTLDEKITAKTDMGAAIKDFYASKSPQLAGRTKEERRKAAIAAVLTARRGGRKLGEECDCEEPETKKNNEVEDSRQIPTKMNLVKNKMRAMGLKMSYEPEGNTVSEEESDRMRDREQERAGMDRPSRYRGGVNPNRTGGVTGPKKKPDPDAAKKAIAMVMAKHGGPKNFM